ncbi:GxxExxY protein [Thioalkalivibrio sulfidiphilus]|uniref:GxxExxY protein n=1 Tax=Thioalkalivibrio sulfidiphilus TaxID=1033854 RepID=UPI00037A1F93|nr:GxxExxY protein [Thioalkalivibrio sulfidiphilus]
MREGREGKLELVGHQVIDASMRVHTRLGPGLLEGAYETCLALELQNRGLRVERQRVIPFVYDGHEIENAYRMDLLIEEMVVVEVKSVDRLNDLHLAQLLSYLRLGQFALGYLLNFNVQHMKQGIRRVVNSRATVI